MSLLLNWLISAVVIIISAYVIPGVQVGNFGAALITAIVLGILNAIVKPLLVLLTLPVNILTLGLFTLVINAIIILIAAQIVPGFKVDGFLAALIFAVVVSLISSLFANIV
ncbi:phage holin family protein [Candidatus Gracilibacteria bacterium]|jgi:putative membrane protein|nr:phage holin family protein [Candidatus Gracilibacteria bacterium]